MPRFDNNVAQAGEKVGVLGAGIVGVCAALELQRRGMYVTLIDRKEPGSETSFGNAGVLAGSSVLPFNNPNIWRALPALLTNRQNGFRYSPSYILKNPRWIVSFLKAAQAKQTPAITSALHALITYSKTLHQELLAEAGQSARLSTNGWLMLYRTEGGFEQSQRLRAILDEFTIDFQILRNGEVQEEEPALRPIFRKALWVKDSAWVNDPHEVVQSYFKLFLKAGGTFRQTNVTLPLRHENGWTIKTSNAQLGDFSKLVLCLGPWSNDILQPLGYRARMVTERGYHLHYSQNERAQYRLKRPILDNESGYVLTPMSQGLRLLTGTELTSQDAPPNFGQLHQSEHLARQAAELGDRLDAVPWMGSRPTLPDGKPAIGALDATKGLYIATGHQHIGFSTGPGSARLLADLITGQQPEIAHQPFEPTRYIKPQK